MDDDSGTDDPSDSMTRARIGVQRVRSDVDRHYWAERMDLLSDVRRMRIFECLDALPGGSVSELAAAAGLTQATVSHALRMPRQRRWVDAGKDGRSVRYRLVDDGLRRLLRAMGMHREPAPARIADSGEVSPGDA